MVELNGVAYNWMDLVPVFLIYAVLSLIVGGVIEVFTGYSHIGLISSMAFGLVGMVLGNFVGRVSNMRFYTVGFGNITVDIGMGIVAGICMVLLGRLIMPRSRMR